MNAENYRLYLFFNRELFFNLENLKATSFTTLVCFKLINFKRDTDVCKFKLALTTHVKVMLNAKIFLSRYIQM